MDPIVKEMLEKVQFEEHELDLYVEEELSKLPPCEGDTHFRGLYGHVPDQGASWLMIAPCGSQWLACQGWCEGLSRYTHLYCSPGCEGRHLNEELVAISLDLGRPSN